MSVKLTILGCGSSGGVPRVGNDWGLCDPNNPKNRRRRCSILLERTSGNGTTSALVDTSPDLREQLISAEVQYLDGVIYTHDHADHMHGIDDLRPLAIRNRERVKVWADARTTKLMLKRFDYCFATPTGSQYPPILEHNALSAYEPLTIDGAGGDITVQPFELIHGEIMALGLRINDVAYTPDVSNIPKESMPYLEDLDCWIIDALRRTPHPSHFSLDDALEWIERMKPRNAVITNMHVDMDYDTLCNELPEGVAPAFDGMVIKTH
ncbi:MAG: MBL fold metallo-hydrolase [Hyphomicrobiales bacterium]